MRESERHVRSQQSSHRASVNMIGTAAIPLAPNSKTAAALGAILPAPAVGMRG